MNNPLVSIIIPTYNRAHLIAETLESIVAQTYQNWECIIVDDGSTDNSAAVIAPFLNDPRFQFHRRPEDRLKGANACRNYGFEISSGDFINWFDSDDIMLPQFLELKSTKLVNSQLDAVICYGAYFILNKESLQIAKPKTDSNFYLFDFVTNEMFLSIAGPLWRRSCLVDKKLFDEKRKKIQDIEFHFRMLTYDLALEFLSDNHLFLIRRGDDRISSAASLTTEKLQDVFAYYFSTFQYTKRVPIEYKKQYSRFTAKKSFHSYYEIILRNKSFYDRASMFFKLRRSIVILVFEVDGNFYKKVRYSIGVLYVTMFRKGYNFFN